MEKVKEIRESDGSFKYEQRKKLKEFFIKLTKYDIVPAALVGIATTNLFVDPMASFSTMELIVEGGLTGAALMLGANGAMTGIKAATMDKEEIRKEIESKNEKGRSL